MDEPAARDPEALSPAAPTADARAQDALLAAALLAVDPQVLGGVRLQAQAGPARDAWLATLQALLPAGAPWRRLPQHASDDRLLGGIDLPATLAAGRPVLQQGVLAAADGGTLLVAMAERLSAAHAAHLCAALDQHAVRIERDGITAHTPTRFVVVALDEALPWHPEARLALAAAKRGGAAWSQSWSTDSSALRHRAPRHHQLAAAPAPAAAQPPPTLAVRTAPSALLPGAWPSLAAAAPASVAAKTDQPASNANPPIQPKPRKKPVSGLTVKIPPPPASSKFSEASAASWCSTPIKASTASRIAKNAATTPMPKKIVFARVSPAHQSSATCTKAKAGV